MKALGLSLIVGLLCIYSCKKDPELILDNDAPYFDRVPRLLIENYVNRLYIDLIGREPFDDEMDADRAMLQQTDVSEASRITIIDRLMNSTDSIEGDISYNHAYHQRLYDLFKVRMLEGASDGEVSQDIGMFEFAALIDSLEMDWLSYEKNKAAADQLRAVLDSKTAYRLGLIGVDEVHQRMISNSVYDFINMNTFNYVNASFDDLFHRFPTTVEFLIAFDMIESNTPGILFSSNGQNKEDYARILTRTNEFYEGVIIWAYITYMAREPTTIERFTLMQNFVNDKDIDKVIKAIVKSDEYANI